MSGPGGALRAAGRLASIGVLAAETLAEATRAGRAGGEQEVRRARAEVFSRAARRALSVHGVELRASGPVPEGPALLVSNHLSYLDPLVIAALVPCAPISKADLAAWPVFGAVARRTGVLFVERGRTGSALRIMRAARRALEEGLPVLNFPEGTTTGGEAVREFRRGLFGVARRARVPVVPLALAYAPARLAWVGNDTFVPHYLAFAALPAATVRVRVGAPLAPQAFGSALALADAAHARIQDLLEEDRPECLRTTR
ncbi:MAG TPA: lysophospholipid acyltransferase family protein [Anaeromyxobacter sp.]|nr:lysophospholipid acyltransferase family protein [Anaeromyxobacter sp.]